MSEYNKRQEDIDLAIVKSDIAFIKEKVKEIDNDLKTDYVSQKEFKSIEDKVSFLTKIVYSAIGIVVVFVITQVLGLIPGK